MLVKLQAIYLILYNFWIFAVKLLAVFFIYRCITDKIFALAIVRPITEHVGEDAAMSLQGAIDAASVY